MKPFFTFLVILFAANLMAQKNTFGGFISADGVYWTKQYKDANAQNVKVFDKKTYHMKAGYAIGVNYERKLKNNLWLTTGLVFANRGYQTKKTELRFSDQILPKKGFIQPSSSDPSAPAGFHAIRFRYNWYMLSVPLGVLYYIPLKKLKIFINPSVGANYFITERVIIVKYGDRITRTKRQGEKDYYNQFLLIANFSAGIEKEIKGYKIRVFPNISTSLTDLYKGNHNIKLYPYSVGLGAGVCKSF
jgi:hypothetical protein